MLKAEHQKPCKMSQYQKLYVSGFKIFDRTAGISSDKRLLPWTTRNKGDRKQTTQEIRTRLKAPGDPGTLKAKYQGLELFEHSDKIRVHPKKPVAKAVCRNFTTFYTVTYPIAIRQQRDQIS
ncbi:hypothetical protein V6N11_002497 [Hibiscus sabdariffa]|uniref:Uncharacterized protein n=1 Tax=Hibiscus sabdariffa TaxID=183260 RepID=A0ABR2SAD8_9ROSI